MMGRFTSLMKNHGAKLLATARRCQRRFRRLVRGRRSWARSLRLLRRRQDRLARRQSRLEARYWDHVAMTNRLAAMERHLERLGSQPKRERQAGCDASHLSRRPNGRLVCSVVFTSDDAPRQLGIDCYSYHFVYRAFERLLRDRFGDFPVAKSQLDLDAALQAADGNGEPALHLAFLPLHYMTCPAAAKNAAFVFWEFPEVPNYDIAGNPRNNWPVVADELAAIFTASSFTRDALINADIRTPVQLVRVPIQDAYFRVPAWNPAEVVTIETPCYWFGGPGQIDGIAHAATDMPSGFAGRLEPRLELRDAVYTSVFNPFDQRKDWPAMLSAFLTTFSGCPEATLVMKFAASPQLVKPALAQFARCYSSLAENAHCRVAVVCEFLSDAQMLELARGTTYVVNSSRAEGACLPVQNFLAAGRPAIAPNHTAMSEYLDGEVGFLVDARREPTHFPFDASRKIATSWWPVVEESLAEQFAASFRVARHDPGKYQAMAAAGRRRMSDFASYSRVREQLDAAIERLHEFD